MAAGGRGGGAPCRRIKLGVASAFFSHASSVTDDFRGVLERLSRGVFDMTFIYFMESATPPDPFILEKKDNHLLIHGRAPNWFESARRDIANLQLDVLLYLDLTMSTWIQKTAYSRLATVQATSHGHPVTSGIPKHIMQYYISWAAAELPYEQVRNFTIKYYFHEKNGNCGRFFFRFCSFFLFFFFLIVADFFFNFDSIQWFLSVKSLCHTYDFFLFLLNMLLCFHSYANFFFLSSKCFRRSCIIRKN